MKNTIIAILALATTFLLRATLEGQVAHAEKTSGGAARAFEYKVVLRWRTITPATVMGVPNGALTVGGWVWNEDGKDHPGPDLPVDRLGNQGWELVSVTAESDGVGQSAGSTTAELWMFKRSK